MPTLAEHNPSSLVKLLIVGDPGSGKTGALASLVNVHDLQLYVFDFDNGLDILHQYVEPERRAYVHYETLTDKMKMADSGQAIPLGEPTAWTRAVKLLNKWDGGVATWDSSRVLVVDSLTLMGVAAMHFVKHANSATMEPDWGYYGPAMELQSKLLELLYSDGVNCHVIMLAHIVHIAPRKNQEIIKPDGKVQIQSIEVGDAKAYPSALGNKLPPKIGRYFNAVIKAKTSGKRHILQTTSDEEIELKTPIPKAIKDQLSLDTGLAEYFTAIRKVQKEEGV